MSEQNAEAFQRGIRPREWRVLRLELSATRQLQPHPDPPPMRLGSCTCPGTTSNCGELRLLSMKPGDGEMLRSFKRAKPGCPVAAWPRRSGLAPGGCNKSSTRRGKANEGGEQAAPKLPGCGSSTGVNALRARSDI